MKFLKIYSIAFLLGLITYPVLPQNTNVYFIDPGIGVGKLKLNLSKEQAFKIVGEPEIRENYSEAVINISNLKSNPYNWIAFQLGFDSVFTYTQGSESYPVYSLYFKSDSLVCISLSAFNYKKWWIENFTIQKKVYLNNDVQVLLDSLPNYNCIMDYSQGKMEYKTYVYFAEGLSVLVYKDKVKMIEIFRKTSLFDLYKTEGFQFK